MGVFFGKDFSHLGLVKIYENENIDGNIFLIKTKEGSFFTYMGNLGIDDFLKIIPKNIASSYMYHENLDNLDKVTYFNISDYNDLNELSKKNDTENFIVKMTAQELIEDYNKTYDDMRVVPWGITYSLFNISSGLKNLNKEKQIYLLDKNYDIVKK